MKKRVMVVPAKAGTQSKGRRADFPFVETGAPPSRGRLLHTVPSLFIKALVVGVVAFVTAAAFSAYLKPGMLIEFANLVLCM
jgi:hypothetical protein